MGDFHREPRPGKGYIRILKLKTPSTDRLKEKQTRSIFFSNLKPLNVRLMVYLPLPYRLTTNSIGPSNFPSASFSFILRFTIVVKEIECLRNISTHSRFTRTWESVLCRQFYLPNWLQKIILTVCYLYKGIK